MKIAILVEGKTEKTFIEGKVRDFIISRVRQRPSLRPIVSKGRISKEGDLKRTVEYLLDDYDVVIALTDVYTSSNYKIPRDFKDAADAKAKMRAWVGNNPKFYPHAAQYDFEAWLLPYWSTIQKLVGQKQSAPPGQPEQVNHTKPPSKRIMEFFETSKRGVSYNKIIHSKHILEKNDLLISANACPELKAFLNTILSLCGGEIIA